MKSAIAIMENTALSELEKITELSKLDSEVLKKDVKPETGENALHLAITQQRIALVDWLIHNAPALINNPNAIDVLPIQYAVSSKFQSAFLKLMLVDSTQFDQPICQNLPHRATQTNQPVVLSYLKYYMDLNKPDIYGLHPIHHAAVDNNLKEALEYLLKDAKIPAAEPRMTEDSKKGWTAAHIAAYANADKALKLLLEYDQFTANVRSCTGQSPFHIAILYDSQQALEVLCRSPGSNPMILDDQGFPPLYYACAYGQYGCVERLIKYYAYYDGWFSKNGETPFTAAVFNGHVEVVALLLDRQAIMRHNWKMEREQSILPFLQQTESISSVYFSGLIERFNQMIHYPELEASFSTLSDIYSKLLGMILKNEDFRCNDFVELSSGIKEVSNFLYDLLLTNPAKKPAPEVILFLLDSVLQLLSKTNEFAIQSLEKDLGNLLNLAVFFESGSFVSKFIKLLESKMRSNRLDVIIKNLVTWQVPKLILDGYPEMEFLPYFKRKSESLNIIYHLSSPAIRSSHFFESKKHAREDTGDFPSIREKRACKDFYIPPR